MLRRSSSPLDALSAGSVTVWNDTRVAAWTPKSNPVFEHLFGGFPHLEGLASVPGCLQGRGSICWAGRIARGTCDGTYSNLRPSESSSARSPSRLSESVVGRGLGHANRLADGHQHLKREPGALAHPQERLALERGEPL